MRILFGLILTLIAFAAADPAAAHAQLRGSEPVGDSVLAEAPATITLRFNETVSPLVLRWITPDGSTQDVTASALDSIVTVEAPVDLAQGTHLLSWRVVSSDGHPVGGTLTFHIGAATANPPPSLASAPGAARAAVILRFGLTVSLICAVGIAVFGALIARGPLPTLAGQILRAATALSIPFGALLIGVQGLDLLSLPAAALLIAPPWQAGSNATVAMTGGLAMIAVLLANAAWQIPQGKLRIALALLTWAIAALSFAVSGHAVTATPRGIALPAMILHAVALVFWMGALLPLVLILRLDQANICLRRFSTMAMPLVALLFLSGGTITWLQSGSLDALAWSTYGAVLGAKLVMVCGLMTLAARNRMVLTPALAAGDSTALPRLARVIRVEILLGLAVLTLASSFRLTPPPRALTDVAEPLYAHIHTSAAMVDIQLTPGRAGPVMVTLDFQHGDFSLWDPQEVEVTFAMADTGIEPIRSTALHGDDGLWRAGPITLSRPGEWDMTLRLLVSDFERVTLTETLTLPR